MGISDSMGTKIVVEVHEPSAVPRPVRNAIGEPRNLVVSQANVEAATVDTKVPERPEC